MSNIKPHAGTDDVEQFLAKVRAMPPVAASRHPDTDHPGGDDEHECGGDGWMQMPVYGLVSALAEGRPRGEAGAAAWRQKRPQPHADHAGACAASA